MEMTVKDKCLSWVNHFLKVGFQPFILSELVWKRIQDTCRVTDYSVMQVCWYLEILISQAA